MPGKFTPEKRDAVMKHALWIINVIAAPTVDSPDERDAKATITKLGHVLSAVVNIPQNGVQLGRWVDRQTLKIDNGEAMAARDNAISGPRLYPDRMLCASWTMGMALSDLQNLATDL